MSAIIEYLRSFNRKKRFFLVGTALGNPAFRLDSAFSQRLGGTFALEVPSDVFVAIDYHLDWIYASAYLSQEGVNASGKHTNTAGLVFGNQEDVDLIVAFDAGETTHVIQVAIEEALKCKETGEAKNILFLLCGHGYFDKSAYDAYLAGQLEDFAYPREAVEKAMASVPRV